MERDPIIAGQRRTVGGARLAVFHPDTSANSTILTELAVGLAERGVDVSVVTMARGVEGLCVSSKFYTALASGQAVLAVCTSDAEIARIVEKHDCGIHVEPDSPDALADTIERLLQNPDETEGMGRIARDVFDEEYTKDRAVEAYATVIRDVASETADRSPAGARE